MLTSGGWRIAMVPPTASTSLANLVVVRYRPTHGHSGKATRGSGTLPAKWTRIEVLGHLIDSAARNHQRFALALHQDSMAAPGYDGDAQIRVQHYAAVPVQDAVAVWCAYNRLLSFVLLQIHPDKEDTLCKIGRFKAMVLRDLASDYVAHLEHHLQ